MTSWHKSACNGNCEGDQEHHRNVTKRPQKVVAHTFSPGTQEAEAGGSLSLRPIWSIEQVPGQSGLHRAILFKKKNINRNGTMKCVNPISSF